MVLVLKDKAYFNNGELLEIKFYTLDLNGSGTGEESLYLGLEQAQALAKRIMLEANLKLKKSGDKAIVQDSSPTPPTS